MYVIIKAIGEDVFFYRFSHDKSDLYCVVTDNLDSSTKYSEDEKNELKDSKLLRIMGVEFKKIGFIL